MDVPKIVSGGQSGAERAALDWAIARNLPYGGRCPHGRTADDGTIPATYVLTEAPGADYLEVAEWNTRDSDGSVIFTVATVVSDNFKKTVQFGLKRKKPLLHLSKTGTSSAPDEMLRSFVARHRIKVLNVAGSRTSEEPEIESFVRDTLEKAWPSPLHSAPAIHHLRAAQGWLELGNPVEAEHELERLEGSLRAYPEVLELRWHIHAGARNWSACLELATNLLTLDSTRTEAWIHRSFALHELKRTQEAFDYLLPAADKFPGVWTIPYNLACYCAQLGRLGDSRMWLNKALAIDESTVKRSAKEDPDLKPLWETTGGDG
jgi:hypothetical protein